MKNLVSPIRVNQHNKYFFDPLINNRVTDSTLSKVWNEFIPFTYLDQVSMINIVQLFNSLSVIPVR